MSRIIDVLVVGSGMAGLVAALAAARQGRSVRLLSAGVGTLGISSGAVDLLGYVGGRPVAAPWSAMTHLPECHPYRLLGTENVQASLRFFQEILAEQHWPLRNARSADGEDRNTRIPTVMGTLKPTFLLPPDLDAAVLGTAQRVLVLGVEGLRDCRPTLIISQLRRYAGWAERTFTHALLSVPFEGTHRGITALDIARLSDRSRNRRWLPDALAPFAGTCDLILMPPICGSRADPDIRKMASEAARCPVVEMLSIPPGVGGLRLRDALLRALKAEDFELVENARAVRAETDGHCCTALIALASGEERRHRARAFILATGGILGGGIELAPGEARESVLGLNIPVPPDVRQWSEPDIFGSHLFARLGVRVDRSMRPVEGPDAARWANVFFAGRVLGGYDEAAEKSGHGVAIATGWQAGNMAAWIAGQMADHDAGRHADQHAALVQESGGRP